MTPFFFYIACLAFKGALFLGFCYNQFNGVKTHIKEDTNKV